MKQLVIFCLLTGILFMIPADLSATVFDVEWVCQESDDWMTLNCWDPSTYIPNNNPGEDRYYNVHMLLGGDCSATIENGNSIVIDTLEISLHKLVHLGPNGSGFLTIQGGQVINNGFINLASNHWGTAFYIDGDTTFSSDGTGAFVIGNNEHNRLRAVTAGDRVINGVGHSFQGASFLGSDEVLFTNHGIIQSDIIGAYLYLDPFGTGMNYNDGTIDSIISSICSIEPSTWDNTNGLIHASDNCTTIINGSAITGGELATTGTGTIQILNYGSVSDVTISSGKLEMPNLNASNGTMSGHIVNNATIELASAHFTTHIRLSDDTTFSGTGDINIGNYGRNFLDGNGGIELLTNGDQHTIHGADFLGNDLLQIDNLGTIRADISGGVLNVNPDDTVTNMNTGMITASDGGTLLLSPGTWDNTNGTIEADADSIVLLSGVSVTNGELQTTGTGLIQMLSYASISNLIIDAGTVEIPNQNDANGNISGHITNNGTIRIANDHYSGRLRLTDDTTFTGSGEIYLGNFGRNYLDSDGEIRLLTNSAQHTIRGADYVGNNLLQIDNQGTIQADIATGNMYLDAADTGISTSSGTIKATNQGILNFSPAEWDCAQGEIVVEDESAVIFNNGSTINNATMKSSGTGYFEFQNGSALNDFNVEDEALIQINNWHSLNVSGLITNNGTITVESQISDVNLTCTEATTFSGTGELIINNTVRVQGNGSTLTNGSDHTILTHSSRNIEPDIVNDGILDTPTGYSPAFSGTFTSGINSQINVDGTLTSGQKIEMEGTLSGAGTIVASIDMSENSLLSPAGENPGTLTILNLELESGATINYQLDTNGDDLIVVDTDLTFGDTAIVRVTAPNDYLPTGDDHIIFQFAGAISALPQWTINLPDGWTSDGIVLEGSNVVLKNVLLPYGVRIDMPNMAKIGEEFHVTGLLDNPRAHAADVAVFFILQVYNDFWFWDSWAHYAPPEANDVDFVIMDIPIGTTAVEVLPSFIWPDTGSTTVDGLLFWGAALTSDMTEIDGRYTMTEWGYGP